MPHIGLNLPTIHLRQVIATSYNSIDPSLWTSTSVTPYLANQIYFDYFTYQKTPQLHPPLN